MICITNNVKIVNLFGEIKNLYIEYTLVNIHLLYIDILFGLINII